MAAGLMAASGGAEPSQILIAIALRKCNLVSLLLEPKFPSVLNTADVGWFSSDRTIAEYAKEIWNAPFAPIS
jgi:hypothetical protein